MWSPQPLRSPSEPRGSSRRVRSARRSSSGPGGRSSQLALFSKLERHYRPYEGSQAEAKLGLHRAALASPGEGRSDASPRPPQPALSVAPKIDLHRFVFRCRARPSYESQVAASKLLTFLVQASVLWAALDASPSSVV